LCTIEQIVLDGFTSNTYLPRKQRTAAMLSDTTGKALGDQMTQHVPFEIDLPGALRDALTGYDWDRQTIGASDAGVFRLKAAERPTLFLKTEQVGPFAELPDEVTRLRWLGGQGIACPEILRFETHGGHHWLLMSALPGGDLVSQEMAAVGAIAVMAGALRRLHPQDVAHRDAFRRLLFLPLHRHLAHAHLADRGGAEIVERRTLCGGADDQLLLDHHLPDRGRRIGGGHG